MIYVSNGMERLILVLVHVRKVTVVIECAADA